MSVSSILQQIQKKGRIQIKNDQQQDKQEKKEQPAAHRLQASPSARVVDPIVARLKEKRRLEKEQKEKELRQKKGLSPKKEHKSARKKNVQAKRADPHRPPPPPPPSHLSSDLPQKKKMNFNDLMRKASSIDTKNLSISIKNKPKGDSKEVLPAKRLHKHKNRDLITHNKSTATSQANPMVKKTPLPMRQPSSQLIDRLGKGKMEQGVMKKKKSTMKLRMREEEEDGEEEEEEESDMSSFIVSSEEEELAGRRSEENLDYDRDEIWAIFNRGKKRSHFENRALDYDSDDMEATGAEILHEEQVSRRTAEIEDKKEMEEEARLARLKRARRHR